MSESNKAKTRSTERWQLPVRWGGFLPFGLVAIGAILYFWLFFDGHLRRGIEYGLTAMNGAEVDIGYLKTRLFQGELTIKKVEFGNPSEPAKNRIEIESLQFSMRLLPLMKKQVVIRESSLLGLKYGTPRQRPARIPTRSDKPSAFTQNLVSGLDQALKKKVGEGELEKLGSLLGGGTLDSKAIEIGAESNSFQQLKAAETLLKNSTEVLEGKVKNLPDDKALAAMKGRLDAITKSKPANVEEIARQLGDLAAVGSQVNDMATKAKEVGEGVTKSVSEVNQSIASVESAIDKDVDYFKNKLKIPQLGFQDLTLPLLGPKLAGFLAQATRYVAVARRYMPAKKKGETELVVVQERLKGKDFQFGRLHSYPSFLLEKSTISSTLSEDPTQGDAKGEIIGVNSNPAVYGRPTTATVNINLPRAGVSGASLSLLIDHVTDIAKEQGTFRVDTFPVEQWVLTEGEPFQLKVERAKGRGKLEVGFEDDAVRVQLDVALTDVTYATHSANSQIEGMLKRALGSFSTMQLKASVIGRGDDLEISMTSDLGERLGKVIQSEIQGQVDALNQQVRRQVTEAVNAKKKEVTSQLDSWKNKTLAPIEAKVKGVTDQQAHLGRQVEGLNRAKDELIKGKAQGELDKLKSAIPFPKF